MNYNYSRTQLAAIIKVAEAMIAVDGKVENVETALYGREMVRIKVSAEEFEAAYQQSCNLKYGEALKTISMFSHTEKKHVAALLLAIMAIDGNIDESEQKLWSFVSNLCSFPSITVKDVLDIMNIQIHGNVDFTKLIEGVLEKTY